jgi:hypothetical protein
MVGGEPGIGKTHLTAYIGYRQAERFASPVGCRFFVRYEPGSHFQNHLLFDNSP